MRKLSYPTRFASNSCDSLHICGKPNSSFSEYFSPHEQLSHNILVGIKANAGEDNSDLIDNTSKF